MNAIREVLTYRQRRIYHEYYAAASYPILILMQRVNLYADRFFVVDKDGKIGEMQYRYTDDEKACLAELHKTLALCHQLALKQAQEYPL